MADSGRQRRRSRSSNESGVKGKKRAGKQQSGGGRNLIAALNHTVRRQMLRLLNRSREPLSPVKLSQLLGMPLTNLSYHMDVLRKCGAVTVVDERQVRGAVEHFYVSDVADNPAVDAMLGETKTKDEGKA